MDPETVTSVHVCLSACPKQPLVHIGTLRNYSKKQNSFSPNSEECSLIFLFKFHFFPCHLPGCWLSAQEFYGFYGRSRCPTALSKCYLLGLKKAQQHSGFKYGSNLRDRKPNWSGDIYVWNRAPSVLQEQILVVSVYPKKSMAEKRQIPSTDQLPQPCSLEWSCQFTAGFAAGTWHRNREYQQGHQSLVAQQFAWHVAACYKLPSKALRLLGAQNYLVH